ncbi:MAG TPA: Rieske (2Fe-2S) protein [Devosiaceae bacterium]|jgi:3-phenylpropionate/trans-cinnamate dioxygenase ferredoxin subunit|nr:Rieske (2Fe-2S) protein [Devosiaceae bacterium]
MARHVVGKASELEPGERLATTIRGRPVVIFNLHGEYYGLLNRCPHQGAELSKGVVGGIAVADGPGEARCIRPGDFIRCPWHGWEFDIRTGQSWCDPGRYSIKQYQVAVERGDAIVKGPYKAEKIEVSVEDDYLVVDL